MLKQQARLVAAGLRTVDMVTLGAAFPIAYWLREEVIGSPHGDLYPISTYWPLLAASLLVWQFASWVTAVYGIYRTRSLGDELGRLARAFGILALTMAAGQFVLKQKELSRLFFGLYYATAFLLLVCNRLGVRVAARAARRRGYNTRTFAVVGAGDASEAVKAAITAHHEWGYVFAGHILEDDAEPPPGAHVLGRLSQLGTILAEHVLDEVVFAVPRERLDVLEWALALCDEQGVNVKLLLDFFPARLSRVTIEDLDGIPVLSMPAAPSDVAPLVGKRIFDVVVSVLALVVFAPVWLAIATAIKLDSPGPVFFRQRRIGFHGREFWLVKFRSMCRDAEAMLPELLHRNEMDGPVFKMRDDPRVTRVGRFLRKTSLDELPQFWNVLKGEMSVVGPRPPTAEEVKRYQRWHRRRLSVRPGITCTWQVSGRNEVEFARWMELDLHYIDNWSLWHDLKIVLRTIPAVLMGRGAR